MGKILQAQEPGKPIPNLRTLWRDVFGLLFAEIVPVTLLLVTVFYRTVLFC